MCVWGLLVMLTLIISLSLSLSIWCGNGVPHTHTHTSGLVSGTQSLSSCPGCPINRLCLINRAIIHRFRTRSNWRLSFFNSNYYSNLYYLLFFFFFFHSLKHNSLIDLFVYVFWFCQSAQFDTIYRFCSLIFLYSNILLVF